MTEQNRIKSNQEIESTRLVSSEKQKQMELDQRHKEALIDAALDLIKHNKTLESQQKIASMQPVETAEEPDTSSSDQLLLTTMEAIKGLAESMNTPKDITLPNGTKATVTPRVN